MPDIRDTIFDLVKARMATITVANSYRTAIGSNVSVWRARPFWKNEAEGVDVRDPAESSDVSITEDKALDRHSLTVEFRVFGKTHEQVRNQIADVYQAIGRDEYWTNSGGTQLALETNPKGNTMEVDQDEDKILGATITIEIVYDTNKFSES
jgi:hypothetical protein